MISALFANASSLAVGIQSAVTGGAVTDPVDEVVCVDGDDHGGRDAAGVGDVAGRELPITQILERIMLPLPLGAPVHGSGRT